MPWMVRHRFGFAWLFAHDYGPVPAIAQRAWAELLRQLHLPVDEMAMRLPVAVAGMLQVWVAYGLLRRLRCGGGAAALGAAVCAVLPALVTDSHYAWAYYSYWLLAGTVALWATLVYLDDGRRRWLVLAELALVVHCLSNCYAFGLPVALLWVWWRQRAGRAGLREWSLSFGLPCLLALAVIGFSWKWTGAGQIGRLLAKHEGGCTGLQLHQIALLPGMLVGQFGYLFVAAAGAGLCWGLRLNDRRKVLAVWAWVSLLPLTLLTDWSRVGYPASYFNEVSFAAGCLGALLIAQAWHWLAGAPRARAGLLLAAALMVGHLTFAAADAVYADGARARWTGVRTGWGSVKPESGIKAAGWYVRRHVPAEAIVLATHTNSGLEISVAQYYLGRAVLADSDLVPATIESLVHGMAGEVDVFVTEPRFKPLVATLEGFEWVATFTADGRPVRCIYARPALALPGVEEDAGAANARYDKEYRTSQVPQLLPTPVRFDAVWRRYLRLAGR